MGASSLPHRRQLGHDNQVSITSITTTTITITNSNSKSKENKYNHLANSQSWLRSLQASLEQDSILLEILQGSSGEEYASQNDGWNNTTPVCQWSGIQCDSADNVQTIRISQASLEGTIPSTLGQLSTLEELDLSSNTFTGSIPSQILALPKLKILDLRLNKLDGTISLPISTSLKALHLGHNALTGNPFQLYSKTTSLPSTGFESLTTLDLKYNKLKGTLTISNEHLSDLQTLDISNNQMYGTIPSSLGQISTLKFLYLSNNAFTGTIPDDFGSGAPLMQEIFWHGNALTGTIPSSLAEITNLQVLFLDDNKLTGTVPTELCALHLNEQFFRDNGEPPVDVDSTYAELYGSHRQAEERDGCTSIACPAGYQSRGNSKDGVFPCEVCQVAELNPYLGSNSCISLEQDDILDNLYVSTNGPSWTGASNWASNSTPTCEREGIECNSDNEVTSIVLVNKGLSGSLPSGLGFLTKLMEFDVSQNNIGGNLPADLQFAPLEVLNVAQNRLSGVVPSGLCRKSNVNGNGIDGLYSCDVITCRGGTYSPKGRADPGTTGDTCQVCIGTETFYLGMTDCVNESSNSTGLTPYGYAGEICLALFGIALIVVGVFFWRRTRHSSQYISDRAYYNHTSKLEESQKDLRVDDDDIDSDPLAGIDGIDEMGRGATMTFDLKIKDEWSGDKETKQKEVWLDVPKIS